VLGWRTRDDRLISSTQRWLAIRATAASCRRSRARNGRPRRPSRTTRSADSSSAQATSSGPASTLPIPAGRTAARLPGAVVLTAAPGLTVYRLPG